jgi:hypothetical protein
MVGLVVSATAYSIWKFICVGPEIRCGGVLVGEYLAPLESLGLAVFIQMLILSILPTNLFRFWFRYLFLIVFGLTVFIIVISPTTGCGGSLFCVTRLDFANWYLKYFTAFTLLYAVVGTVYVRLRSNRSSLDAPSLSK